MTASESYTTTVKLPPRLIIKIQLSFGVQVESLSLSNPRRQYLAVVQYVLKQALSRTRISELKITSGTEIFLEGKLGSLIIVIIYWLISHPSELFNDKVQ